MQWANDGPIAEESQVPHDAQGFDVRADRVSYDMTRLDPQALGDDPFVLFARWLQDAAQAGVSEPNAMVIATADQAGQVRARTVLLRGDGPDGFTFFTNYDSFKGQALAENRQISACFSWVAIHRQVIIEGVADRVSATESDAYFASRPYESQVASAASPQSQVIGALSDVEEVMAQLERDQPVEVTRPEHWGGYRIIPRTIEFWQGNRGRLHDRFRFRRGDHGWICERLAP